MPNVRQTCVRCPESTISVNGGFLLDFKMEDFNTMDPNVFKVKTDCRIREVGKTPSTDDPVPNVDD